MSMGRMMAMSQDKKHTDRRYETRDMYYNPNEHSSPRSEMDGPYDYDRYRYSNGRFAPKGRGHRTRAEMGEGGVYDAFYDRDGRRHYDNGRYAPMRSEYDERMGDRPIGFDTGEYESRGETRGFYPGVIYQHGGSSGEERRNMMDRQRRELGHASLYEDGDGYFFKGRFGGSTGNREGMPSHMTREIAEKWTREMKNEDGTKGPHWSMEQVKQLQEQKKELQEFDLPDLYAVLNMMYSDYCEVAKKLNVNNIDFYACMAKAWLDDKDAGAGKAKTLMYYECVAK